jgi:LysM repeat protein
VIETIYSNENGDADRTNKVQTSFKMPKNIRQVGKSNTSKKIYVEDYVMTYIKQLVGGDYSGCKIAVLVGQCVKMDNCRNIFISGAVEVKGADISNEIVFTNDTWTAIYEDIKKYFVDTEIVGWFIGGPGYLLEEDEKILKAHVDNFAGQDKTLLTYDNMEREEAFLIYENNRLSKQDGYYIYYEKNEEMQNYMVEHKEEQSSETGYDDRVSREIRTVLQNKKPAQEENKSITRLMYAAGTLLAVIVLVVGAAMLGNYYQMKNIQNTLDYLTKDMEEVQAIFAEGDHTGTQAGNESEDTAGETVTDTTVDTAADTTDTSEDGLNVEVVPGNVEPLEQTDSQSSDKDNEDKDDGTQSEEKMADDQSNSETTGNDTSSEDESTVSQPEVKYYTVVSGDTLADISYKLYKTYTKVNKIKELNNITDSDLIYVGQKLIVP